MKSLFTGASALALSAALVAPTYAQANTEDAGEQPIQDVILITGQKVERSLQDTVASVAVVDAETISQRNYDDLTDTFGEIANVNGVNEGRGFAIRGLQNRGAAAGDQTSDVSAVYIDGVFIPSTVYASGGVGLWDVSSVEVFRGPQSTIQGRNALAGAIVVSTSDPGDTFEGSAQFAYGDYDTYQTSAAVTIPLHEDFALRMSTDFTGTDGYSDNPVLGIDDSGRLHTNTSRAKILFTPSAIPEMEVRLGYTYIDSERGTTQIEEQLWPQQRRSLENVLTEEFLEAGITSLEITYDLSDRITLTSVTSDMNSDYTFSFDPDSQSFGTDVPGMSQFDDEVFSQELRMTYSGDRLEGLLGVYFYESDSDFDNGSETIVGTAFALPDPVTIASVFFGTPTPDALQIAQATAIRAGIVTLVPSFPVEFNRAARDQIENYALFGEFTYSLTDDLRVTLGARYDDESIAQTAYDATIVPPIPATGDPTIDFALNILANQFSNELSLEASNEFSAFLPKAVVSYDLSDDVTASFSYQRAYRAGGLSFNVFRGALPVAGDRSDQQVLEDNLIVNSFDPEFTDNYELSFRSQWMDNALTVNANLFFIEYEDQQINIQLSANPLDSLTDNVGASEMKGFEIDAFYRGDNGLSLYANVGYADTEFTEGSDVVGSTDLTGLEFPYSPVWTAGAGARYEHSSGFYGDMRISYSGSSFALSDNEPTAQNNAYNRIDANVGYQTDRYTIEIYANNLTDQEYLTFNPANGTNGLPESGTVATGAAPRVVGARFLVDF